MVEIERCINLNPLDYYEVQIKRWCYDFWVAGILVFLTLAALILVYLASRNPHSIWLIFLRSFNDFKMPCVLRTITTSLFYY